MSSVKAFAGAAAIVLGLTGCATGSPPAEPHQHIRDTKQGTTLPSASAGATAPRPLHDHRQFK